MTEVVLRDWNRCAIFFNLYRDEGKGSAQAYARRIPKEETEGMMTMYKRIANEGYDFTRAAVNRKIQGGVFADG